MGNPIRLLVVLIAGYSSLSAYSASDELARGAQVYQRCGACHSFAVNRTGPHHCGLLGRRAGGVVGFEYSTAMRESGIIWNRENLNRFLANPMATVAGTTMTFAGIKDERDRRALIQYIVAESQKGTVCGPP